MGQVAARPQTVAEGVHQPHHGVGKRHARQGGALRQLQPQALVCRVGQHPGQGGGNLLHRHQGQGVTDRVLAVADEGFDGVGHGIHGGGGGDGQRQPQGEAGIQHRQPGQQEGGGEGHLAPAPFVLDHRHQGHFGAGPRRGGDHRQGVEGTGQAIRSGIVEQPLAPQGRQYVHRLGGVDDGAAAKGQQAVTAQLPVVAGDPLHHGGGGVRRDLVPDGGDRQGPFGHHIGQQGGEPAAADPLVGEQQRAASSQSPQGIRQLLQCLLPRHQLDRAEKIVITAHPVLLVFNRSEDPDRCGRPARACDAGPGSGEAGAAR